MAKSIPTSNPTENQEIQTPIEKTPPWDNFSHQELKEIRAAVEDFGRDRVIEIIREVIREEKEANHG
ncbi:hypothetical protein [Desulforapulum autotrophicum]|uniref:hypothetical protein n=1 Tax=Desulforapulum autotrophicum TaxID=2296 RepID=UPI0002D59C7E|nr:hypothetical protein [Desulforapulum autotrophicum]